MTLARPSVVNVKQKYKYLQWTNVFKRPLTCFAQFVRRHIENELVCVPVELKLKVNWQRQW